MSDCQWLFSHGTGHFWSSHSGRNFLPSAAAALNVEKSDRDMLGGWTAQESDRYNRVARVRIQAVQALVARTFSDQSNHDPLLEGDAIEEFRLFLQKQGCSTEVQAEYIQKISRRSFALLPRVQEAPEEGELERMDPGEVRWKKMRWRRSWQQRKGRTDEGDSKLGMPTDLRSWEASPIKTLHLFGSCYMIPEIDYPSFTYAGERFPSRRAFHGVCKWCARDEGAQDPGDH